MVFIVTSKVSIVADICSNIHLIFVVDIGVMKDRSTLRYLIQIKDCLDVEEVTACVAAKTIPTHIVSFLENKVEWFKPNEEAKIGSKLPHECANPKGAPARVYCNFFLFIHSIYSLLCSE